MTGERADVALVALGLCESREKAQARIMAGDVYCLERRVNKPSERVDAAQLTLRGDKPFVSRGGYKLDKALREFDISAAQRVCLDIGAAAGGFTGVLLKGGARRVYAIDVGYGQLDYALRSDERVVVMERCNARYLKPQDIADVPTLTVMDVSFISIRLIIPTAALLMAGAGEFATLVKPQFEAGRESVGKKGVVRDPEAHARVLREIRDFAPSCGYSARAFTWSPIKGPEGNIEFLAHLVPGACGAPTDADIQSLVAQAHAELA